MKKGTLVRWREPLDADYMVGYIRVINGKEATIDCKNYYDGITRIVSVDWLEDVHGRLKNGSGKKRDGKRSATKSKLQR
jgi:hypothetical protein